MEELPHVDGAHHNASYGSNQNLGAQLNGFATNPDVQSQASMRPVVYDDNGRPLRVQRTQLLNLQPAGGKNNSSMNVLDAGPAEKPPLNSIETMEENLNKSQEALSNSNIGANA